MLKNYLKIAFRNLIKQKTFSIINILGLSVGMVCFILIMSWVQDEFSYDRFHKNADHIYRIGLKGNINGNDIQSSTTPGKWGPALKEAFPEVVNSTRYARQGRKVFRYKQKYFYEDGFTIADASIFEMFDFPFISGNPETALAGPLNMVITEKIAEKYFGDENPINKTISLDEQPFRITGIIKNIPHNSHIQFDILCSIDLLEKIPNGTVVDWQSDNFSTYLLIGKSVNIASLNKKIDAFIQEKVSFYKQVNLSTFMQPLTNIYLNPRIENYSGVIGDIRYVYIFTLIAFFILLIACFNYINLTTALSTERNKEVGIRKVIGSSRKQLIIQFLSESFVLCFIACVIAVILAELFLPVYNRIADKNIQFNFSSPALLLELFFVMTLVAVIAGCYPAFYLSILNPISTIKTTKFSGTKGKKLRRVFVIVQFVISIILITGTLCIYEQIVFLKNKNLGFNKTNVLYIPSAGEIGKKYEYLKNELLKNPNIVDITAKSCPLTHSNDASVVLKRGEDVKDAVFMRFLSIDYNYVDFMGLKLIAGRNFSKDFSTDLNSACIMNEEAMRQLGLKDKIGTVIKTGQNETRTIIGVLKNAHFGSLKNQTEPRLYRPLPDLTSYNEGIILIKIKDKGQRKIYTDVLGTLEQFWEKLNPDAPFEYFFVDAIYDQLYKAEERMNKIFLGFTSIAILLSCLGLFGLASFTSERKTKEIGIRKVLGATVPSIVSMLSKDFIRWVLLSNIIACPAAYYLMNKWLEDFAYRIDITWWMFALSGGIALVIALATVSFQAVKAATANPVESLRYE